MAAADTTRDGARPVDALLRERYAPGPQHRGPERVERLVLAAIDEVSRERGMLHSDVERSTLAKHVTMRLHLSGLLA